MLLSNREEDLSGFAGFREAVFYFEEHDDQGL
jgi:hypothetical protein